jgi:hypothetical protein
MASGQVGDDAPPGCDIRDTRAGRAVELGVRQYNQSEIQIGGAAGAVREANPAAAAACVAGQQGLLPTTCLLSSGKGGPGSSS